MLAFIKITLGSFLFIPGIYYHYRYYFAEYSLLDRTTQTVAEDMKTITRITTKVKLRLFTISLLSMLILAKIIVVSHLTSLKEQFPVHFQVQKTPQGSMVQVIEHC